MLSFRSREQFLFQVLDSLETLALPVLDGSLNKTKLEKLEVILTFLVHTIQKNTKHRLPLDPYIEDYLCLLCDNFPSSEISIFLGCNHQSESDNRFKDTIVCVPLLYN